MANRRRTRTLPKEKGPFVRRDEVLAVLQRESERLLAGGGPHELFTRVRAEGGARALASVVARIEALPGVGCG